ncbi:hypothetical protein [uncultured Thermanaerothrix sp.]|uniref:hypothetical protein n=1 Tax=uncultured Thermanaerothrix sp. TaxID=1195149 RepID=UPI002630F5D9|nr:hypothetical protein [uncultured Thermanaerothrix sp.]
MALERGTRRQLNDQPETSGSFWNWVTGGWLVLAAIGVTRADWWFTTYVPGQWPAGNWLALLLGALVGALFWLLAYSTMARIIASPGSDYYIATRFFSPSLGFAGSFVGMIASALFAGGMVAAFFRFWLPGLFQVGALVLPQLGLDSLAEAFQTSQMAALLGTVGIFLAFLLVLFAPRGVKFLLGAGAFLVVIWGILLVVFLLLPSDNFARAYESLYGSGVVERQVNLAVSFGLILTRRPVSSFLMGMGLSLWFLQGGLVALSALDWGRVKRSSLGWLIMPLLVLIVLLGLVIAFLQDALPGNLLAAHSWLYLHQAAQAEFFLPWSVFYLLLARPSLTLLIFFVLLWSVLLLNLLQAYLYSVAQIIAGWAKDGLVPSSWGYQRRGQQVPVMALFITAFLTLLGMTAGLHGAWMALVVYYPYALAVSSLAPLLALILYLWRFRDQIAKSVSIFQRVKFLAGKILVGLVSLVIALSVLWGTVGFSRELRLPRELGFAIILLWVAGLGLYWGRLNFWRQRGYNLDENFRSAPTHPE